MSIHVTVSSNPINIGRGRVLLTDIETAKKNEWLRRRKVRLQQVRQQARDLAHSVRKKVSGDENILEKNEEDKKTEQENKHIHEQITSLQHEFQDSVSQIGTGHHLASIRTECKALAREKEELRDALAKARGAIAEERLKAEKSIQKEKSQVSIERKKMARQIEDLRSTLISNLPEAKSSVSLVKKSTTKVQIHRSDEPNEEDVVICKNKVISPTRKFQTSNMPRPRPAARSSLSPPRTVNHPVSFRRKKSDHDEENSSDEESDDSDVTWPPRSARVTKEPIQPVEPPRVRFYDHNSRVVKNSPRPSYCIKQMDPYEQPDMGEAIADEEEATVRKENLDIMARREKIIRGNKALRKERSKKEAERFLKEIREIQRKEKIEMAINRSYPSEVHLSDYRRKEIEKRADMTKSIPVSEGFVIKKPMSYSGNTSGLIFDTCGVKTSKVDPEASIKLDLESSAESDDFFEELVNKLKIERAKKQHELETKFGVKGIDDADIPDWVKAQETAGPSGIRKIPTKQDRAVSPVKYCSCCSRCTCRDQAENYAVQNELEEPKTVVHSMAENSTEDVNKENSKDDEHPNIISNPHRTDEIETKIVEKHIDEEKNISQGVSVMSESLMSSSVGVGVGGECASTNSSSQSETVESSLTFEGIKVTVKVSEKGKKKKKDRLSEGRGADDGPETIDKHIQTSMELTEESPASRNMSWNNRFTSTEATTSGSTSYFSPPSKLSPAHQSLLKAILTKIDTKNKNPRLHQYIKKVLEMSRNSIEQLPVSSVSDVSINSSVFDRSRNNRTQSLYTGQKDCRYNVSCQANTNCSDDSTTKEEMLKFSELAENYAHRLQDLACMMERMRMLPDTVLRVRERGEDSSAYLSPPPEIHQSVRLSNSVKAGVYPSKLADESVHRATEHRASPGLPSSHIHPHPSAAVNLQHSTSNNHQFRRNGVGLREGVPHELSTIQEGGESQRPETPQPGRFDPDVSSIRGTPRQPGGRDSTGSSLCLLDDQDISSWLGSSSDDFEEVFKSLGIAWALPTVRKTRQSQRRTSDSQTSSRSTGHGQYSHSTPLGPSPAKARDALPSHRKYQSPLSADSDSLTPPSLSLNVPKSVMPKERNSR